MYSWTLAIRATWNATLLFPVNNCPSFYLPANNFGLVLLRVVEYYEGILILTTNRIKTFDVVVQSRVHLVVRYQDLTVEDRKQVFKTFCSQLTTENCSELRAIKGYIDDFDEELNRRHVSSCSHLAC